MQELLYEDLTFTIRSCIFEVHNDIGVGFDEETYHQGLARKFVREGISFVSKERIKLKHRGILVREFELDYLIEDKVILALKCLPCDFLQVNFIQLFTELKLWQKQLGLLVNFGLPKVKIERRIYHEKPLIVDENYDYIKGQMDGTERQALKSLREAILFVAETHGLGFGKSVMRKLLETELAYQQIKFEKNFSVLVNYLGETIRVFKMRHFLIENSIICGITALQESITHHDISKIKSYLKALKLSIGLAVNFGKSKLAIQGVRN
jgi:GxxExxY protein